MSASERLKVLEQAVSVSHDLKALSHIGRALPQIVALTEAAERGREHSVLLEQDISGIEKVGWRVEDAQAVNFALQALERALS